MTAGRKHRAKNRTLPQETMVTMMMTLDMEEDDVLTGNEEETV